MSKEGSYEYEMQKITRMVLTICHVHKNKFLGLNTSTMSARVKEHIQIFFNYKLTDSHINELGNFLPDVFEIINHGTNDWVNYGISINIENADLLEIW